MANRQLTSTCSPIHGQLIADELSALLERSNEDAFVIFEDAETGKFVQFAGRVGDPLVPVGQQASFQMNLGDDVQRATQITMAIFEKVFQSSDVSPLRIKRN